LVLGVPMKNAVDKWGVFCTASRSHARRFF
jgi:hypothetical protein